MNAKPIMMAAIAGMLAASCAKMTDALIKANIQARVDKELNNAFSGPNFSGLNKSLFPDIQAYSATTEYTKQSWLLMEFGVPDDASNPIIMRMKLSVDSGKSRSEFINTAADILAPHMSPAATARWKSNGLDQIPMVTVTRLDKKVACLIYPGRQSYVERDLSEAESAAMSSGDKTETTELGQETVEGHPCVRNKAIVTDKRGYQHELIVWKAADLNNFPVKIETYIPAGDWIFKQKDNAEAVVTDQEGDQHGFCMSVAELDRAPRGTVAHLMILRGQFGDAKRFYKIKPGNKQLPLEDILENIPHRVETNKVETDERGCTWTSVYVLRKNEAITYKDVKLAKPDPSLFDPPSGYTRYESRQEMMMDSLKRK